MISAYNDIRNTYHGVKGIKDLRTAAFTVALNKIKDSYYSMGIFP